MTEHDTPRRVLSYAGRAGGLWPILRNLPTDPLALAVSLPETYLLPLSVEEMASLYHMLASLKRHGVVTTDDPNGRLLEKVRVLAVAAGLLSEPERTG